MKRKLISSGSEFETRIGYSRAVADGDYVFVSGTTGYDYDAMSISDDILEQTEQCFKNIQQALIDAQSDLDNVVRVRYVFANKQDFELSVPILNKYLGTVRPATSIIVAELLDDLMKVQIEVTARIQTT